MSQQPPSSSSLILRVNNRVESPSSDVAIESLSLNAKKTENLLLLNYYLHIHIQTNMRV